jgi:hypothetical protein
MQVTTVTAAPPDRVLEAHSGREALDEPFRQEGLARVIIEHERRAGQKRGPVSLQAGGPSTQAGHRVRVVVHGGGVASSVAPPVLRPIAQVVTLVIGGTLGNNTD